jgi:hypothetical protein
MSNAIEGNAINSTDAASKMTMNGGVPRSTSR